MSIAAGIRESMERSSFIRKMFEEGLRLKKQFGEENVFDFSLGNPDLNPPVEFFDTVKALMEKPEKGAHGYMPNAGFPDVCEAIANKASKEYGVVFNGSLIVMSCGAAGGLNAVLKAILNPGDQVIVLKPYFVEYGFYIANHGGVTVTADTDENFSLSIPNIEKSLNEKTRALIINSPNNPTGRVYPEREIQALAALLKKHMAATGRPLYLLSDEPYRDIVYDGVKVPSLFTHYPQTIAVTSYSKTLSVPGERIGYIAVHPQCEGREALLAGIIFSTRILGYVNAPALMQRAVARLGEVKVNVNAYKKRRDLLCDGLKFSGYTFTKPEGAFYIFCSSPVKDDVAFAAHLQKYNVLVVPGVGFGAPGYFRIAYCVSESVIQRAIPRFKEAMESL